VDEDGGRVADPGPQGVELEVFHGLLVIMDSAFLERLYALAVIVGGDPEAPESHADAQEGVLVPVREQDVVVFYYGVPPITVFRLTTR